METFTFYSYKGGTGRTLLVANAARYLANLGKRVVALDFDLEAPGLHYKLRAADAVGRAGDVPPARGVVDYLLAISTNGAEEAAALSDYVVRVPLPRTTTGELYLMPAGAAPTGDYWRSLTTLTRGDFFADPEGSGIAACLDLKARIESELQADFLLIDSRTGITEMAGLATTLLADRVVCMMIDNPESLAGTRAVMRSFGQAPRLKGQEPIGLLPVLSRTAGDDDETKRRVLRYLNEPTPDTSEASPHAQIYVLRTDPGLAETERLLLGGGDMSARSPLYQDYLAVLRVLVTADPALVATAERRRLAVIRMKDWLTGSKDRSRYDLPDPFDEEQLEEGVNFGKRQARYADIVVYGGKDRTEALMAIEYVEDLESSEAWQWWEGNTNLRCAILIGTDKSVYLPKRIFTRDRRAKEFRERDETAGWFVKWPASFTALDDPGDRSVESMLYAVQRGEDSFIRLLVTEWERGSFVTLHGGSPYRPRIARQILDGLARITDPETEMHILWRTAQDPFGRRYEDFKGGGSAEEFTTRELHAPLWWRLSVPSKIKYLESGHPRGQPRSAGLDLLACDILGLVLDQDRDFRRDAPLLGEASGDMDEADYSIYNFSKLFRDRELKFEISEEPPPEFVRRLVVNRLLGKDGNRNSDDWSQAEHDAAYAMRDPVRLAHLLRSTGRQWPVAITNLLCSYDPASCRVTVYPQLVAWAANQLGVDQRALANVAFLHATVYAIAHLGRDLDGRMWNDFGLPPARDINYRPSLRLETLARYFSSKLLERLGDAGMTTAFDRLGECQPPEYQAWQRLRSEPIEEIRKILMHARAGLDGVLPAKLA